MVVEPPEPGPAPVGTSSQPERPNDAAAVLTVLNVASGVSWLAGPTELTCTIGTVDTTGVGFVGDL